MKFDLEVSADGKQWRKATLFSALPIPKKSRYIISIKNLVLFSYRNLTSAKKAKRKIRNDLSKVGMVMELAGYRLRIFAIRDIPKPKYEDSAIDAEFEVIN